MPWSSWIWVSKSSLIVAQWDVKCLSYSTKQTRCGHQFIAMFWSNSFWPIRTLTERARVGGCTWLLLESQRNWLKQLAIPHMNHLLLSTAQPHSPAWMLVNILKICGWMWLLACRTKARHQWHIFGFGDCRLNGKHVLSAKTLFLSASRKGSAVQLLSRWEINGFTGCLT